MASLLRPVLSEVLYGRDLKHPLTLNKGVGVRVLPSDAVLTFQGDSLTLGLLTTVPFPTRFAAIAGHTANNLGISGQLLSSMDTNYSANTAPSFAAGKINVLGVLGGTNDLAASALATAVEASLASLCSKAKATGFYRLVMTIAKRNDAAWDSTKETQRGIFNTWLRANWRSIADWFFDLDAVTELQNTADTTYYNVDALHWTDLTNQVVAENIRLILQLPGVLQSLTLANTSTTAGVAWSSRINGRLTGSTITATSSDGTTLTVTGSSIGGTIVSGTFAAAGAPTITLTETLASASGSPKASTPTVTVASAGSSTTFASGGPISGTGALSNGNKSFTSSSSAFIQLTSTALSGKQVFAVTVDTAIADAGFFGVGISNASPDGTSIGFGGNGSAGLCNYNNGTVFAFGGQAFSYAGSSFVAGATLGVVVDYANAVMWFTHDGTTFYGTGGSTYTLAQVNAGTGGITFATTKGFAPIFGGVTSLSRSNPVKFTLLTTWPWTLPTGYAVL